MTDSPNPPAQLGGQAIGRAEALTKTSGPGIALMVVGGIGVFWNIISILLNIFSTGASALGSSSDGMGIALLSGGIGIASSDVVVLTFADSTWRSIRPTSGPGARSGHVLAWDAAGARLVLFGGGNAAGIPQNDAWT